jgi:hypothetical protein
MWGLRLGYGATKVLSKMRERERISSRCLPQVYYVVYNAFCILMMRPGRHCCFRKLARNASLSEPER